MERINHNRQYLYCSVDLDLSLISDLYSSSKECFDDYKKDIISDCQRSEYNKEETNAVLNHYQCRIEMWGGKWGKTDKYFVEIDSSKYLNWNFDVVNDFDEAIFLEDESDAEDMAFLYNDKFAGHGNIIARVRKTNQSNI